VLFVDRGGRQVLSFSGVPGERLAHAGTALRGLLADRRRRALRIERIDGEPALDSALRPHFEAAGFRAEYKGLTLDRFTAERPLAREG
jgi:ATP-dependent Lhr-like helicase